MRTAWNITSFLAVANLLAVLMCVAWLWQSDRLDHERIASIRQLLSTTVGEDAKARKKQDEALAAENQRRAQERRQSGWPMAGGELISRMDRFDDHAALVLRRVQDENARLMLQLESREEAIAAREQELAQRQLQWQQSIQDEAARRGDDQFAKTVRILETLPPKQARQTIQKLVETGKSEQAVSYLNAMNARSASRIVREFKTDADITLATELLERLRTFGLFAGLESELRDADAPAQPVEPSA